MSSHPTDLPHPDWSSVFEDLPNGFQAPQIDRAIVDAAGGRGAAIYGELDERTFARILAWWRPGPDDMLLDLGSGTGRFALQAVCSTKVGRVRAIELSPFRHQTASTALERLIAQRGSAKTIDGRLELVAGDFLTEDLGDATLVYCGSTCFSEPLWERACARVDRELLRLRSFVAPRPLLRSFTGSLREVGRFPGGASWMDEVDVYAFGR